jgi:hypothetical protein
MKYGKYISVTINQNRGDYFGDVKFMDALDYETFFRVGTRHLYVSPSSMRRLATAINNSGMRLELDEYGVPTWTRSVGEVSDE